MRTAPVLLCGLVSLSLMVAVAPGCGGDDKKPAEAGGAVKKDEAKKDETKKPAGKKEDKKAEVKKAEKAPEPDAKSAAPAPTEAAAKPATAEPVAAAAPSSADAGADAAAAPDAAAEAADPEEAVGDDEGATIEGVAAQLKFEGIVTAATSEWFDKKKAAKKNKGWLRVKSSDAKGAIDDRVKVALFKAGDVSPDAKPVKVKKSDTYLKVEPGTYDVQLRYKGSKLAKAQGWVKGVKLEAGKLLRLRTTFDFPTDTLKVTALDDKTDVSDKTFVWVYKAGADEEEGESLMRFKAADPVVMPPGEYDLRIKYKEAKGLDVEVWSKGLKLAGKGKTVTRKVKVPLEFAFVALELTNFKEPVDKGIRWYLHPAGTEEHDRKKALVRARSLKPRAVAKGKYDLLIQYRIPNKFRHEVWIKGVKVPGKRKEIKVKKDLKWALGTLTIEATRKDGRKVGKKGKVKLYEAGALKKDPKAKPIAKLKTNDPVVVPAGKYDLEVSHKGGMYALVKKVTVKKGKELTKKVKLKKKKK